MVVTEVVEIRTTQQLLGTAQHEHLIVPRILKRFRCPNGNRYQFLSLAYLIVYGKYPERYGATGTPSIVAEREWKSWDSFYSVRASSFRHLICLMRPVA